MSVIIFTPQMQQEVQKDLDNLLKILLDVLSVNMVNGQDKKRGLGFVGDDSKVFEIHAMKKIINDEKKLVWTLKFLIGSF